MNYLVFKCQDSAPRKIPRIWFLVVRKTYPWTTLVITSGRLICPGANRNKEKIRFWMAVVKIDFAGFLALMNDLLW